MAAGQVAADGWGGGQPARRVARAGSGRVGGGRRDRAAGAGSGRAGGALARHHDGK